MLQTSETVIIFPEVMNNEIYIHNGLGVMPEDEINIGPIKIISYYMYTFPVDDFPSSHPSENNYCSYIIDIGGFTIFHAGDSDNIPEYEALKGAIDVALLPLGPGCQTMCNLEVIDALNVIEPSYFMPIHYTIGEPETFFSLYDTYIDHIEVIYLPYFSKHEF
jgi:L-ascorbate metabolism protein UlaG (beta-lactamase superfamily)